MQQFVHMQGLAALALSQFGNRNTGPLRNNPGNLILGDTLMYQTEILIFHFLFLFRQLFLQFRQLAVLEFSRFVEVIRLLRCLNLAIYMLNLFTQFGQLINGRFFIFPLGFLGRKAALEFCQFFLQFCQAILT